jgi:hypothetical protein
MTGSIWPPQMQEWWQWRLGNQPKVNHPKRLSSAGEKTSSKERYQADRPWVMKIKKQDGPKYMPLSLERD